MNSLAEADELIDVPEAAECDPFEDLFEDDVTGEIVLLDVMRLDLADIELL